ncbi:MAG: NAD-dependent epimerase/dehydratase family protein, partial [Nitrospirota bacterium]
DIAQRPVERLRRGDWEVRDGMGNILAPVPTSEAKTPSPASIYALSKYDQEQMCLMFGAAYGFPAVVLRFFNVYGTRQAISNPYTGVLAIFASRLLNSNSPLIFEDGLQRRDFVSVHDVSMACRLALENDLADSQVINIGSGRDYTVLEIAREMTRVLGKEGIAPEITRKYRASDIRHCFADISLAGKLLGYEPEIPLETGLIELASWFEEQIAEDRTAGASSGPVNG